MNDNIKIQLSVNPVQLRPGESVDLSVTITNNTQAVAEFELSVTGIEASWFKFDWPEMTLYPDEPGNEGTVYLHLSVPLDAPAGNYSPAIQVSNRQQEVLASLPFVLSVQQVDVVPLTFSLYPQAQETTGRAARFQIQLKNNLGRHNPVRLNAKTLAAGSEVRTLPPVVELPPYTEGLGFVDLYLEKRNWIGADRRYDFSVAVENTGAELNGFLIQTCYLPWLRRLLVTPLLLVAALLLPLLAVGLLLLLYGPWNNNNTVNIPPAFTQASLTCVQPNTNVKPGLFMTPSSTNIYITRPDGTQNFLGSDQTERLPGLFSSLMSISPDGNSLAYVTARNEALDGAEIEVFNGINTAAPVKTTVAAVEAGSSLWTARPVWSRDSNKLGYVVRKGQKLELWMVNLNGTDTRPRLLGTPDQLQPRLFYGEASKGKGPLCWSIDDNRLLIETGSNIPPTEVPLEAKAVTPTVKPAVAPDKLSAFYFQAQIGGVKEPQLAPLAQNDCFTATYSQNDPIWRDQQIKSADNRSLAEAGCPFTAAAMMLNFYKSEVRNPADLNDCLNKQGVSFDWSAAANCSNGRMQGGQRVPFKWDELNSSLKRGQPAVVGLLGGQTGSHFVVVVSGNNGIAATYRVNDPWDGSNYKSLADFISTGYQLAWLVNYSGGDTPACKKDLTEQLNPLPFNLAISSPLDGKAYNTAITFDYQADANVVIKATLFNVSGGSGNATIQTVRTINKGDRIEGEGNYRLVVESTLETQTYSRSIYFTLDQTPPAVATGFPDTKLDNTTTTGPKVARGSANVEIKAIDDLSGIATIEYQYDNRGFLPYSTDIGGKPVPFKDTGSYNLTYRVTDGAGNVTTGALPFTIISESGAAPTDTAGPGGNNPNDPNADPNKAGLGGIITGANQVTFAATDTQQSLELTNTGQGPTTWSFQATSSLAATYLKAEPANGTLAPNDKVTINLTLTNFNFTPAVINAPFSIAYNNNTAKFDVKALITQQPQAVVVFTSPQPAEQLNPTSVDIGLSVTTAGAATPHHVTLTAKYADQVGGPLVDHPLGQALPPNWILNWNTSKLVPQTGVQINGQLCWKADDSACQKIVPGVTGLTVAKPVVNITLSPDTDKLSGNVSINSQVVSGIIDHITYRYTYKKDATDSGTIVTLSERANANKNRVNWDTTVIPPQSGIKLDALVCWGPGDDAASCTTPANPLPSLTVENPVITVENLADTDRASLPLSVTLKGTVAKLNTAGAAVWVDVTYTPAGSTIPINATFKGTLSTVVEGKATWNIGIPTDNWPSQPNPATFTPKVCWDGDPNGPFCQKVTNPQTGTIPPFTAPIVFPSDGATINDAITIRVAPIPASRIDVITFQITYTPIGASTPITKELTATASGQNPTISFDSVALGLSPQPVTLSTRACKKNGPCGTFSTPLNLTIGDSILAFSKGTNLTQGSSSTCADPCLAANAQMEATLTGRGAGKIKVFAVYQTNPMDLTASRTVSTTISTNSNIRPDSFVTEKWDTTTIPPQAGITFRYSLCWGGSGAELQTQEKCLPDVDTNLGSFNSTQPSVSQVFLNNQEYKLPDSTDPKKLAIVPVPIQLTGGSVPIISIPLSVTVNGPDIIGVQWRLEINDVTNKNPANFYNNSAGKSLGRALTPVTGSDGKQYFVTSIRLDLTDITPASGTAFTDYSLVLVAHPIWNRTGFGQVEYNDSPPGATTVKRLPVRLVTLDVNITEGKGSNKRTLYSNTDPIDNPSIMISTTTNLKVTPKVAVDGVLQRVVFESTGSPNGSTAIKTTDGKDLVATNDSSWQVDWVHNNSSPVIKPQTGIIVGWRLCSTKDDYSGCLPILSKAGIYSQVPQDKSLTLGGVQFFRPDPTDSTNILNNKDNLPSEFQASVLVPGTDTNTGIVRFWAYVPGKPDDHRVLLVTKAGATTDKTSASQASEIPINTTFWNARVTWRYDDTNILTLAEDAADNRVTISAQYCLLTGTAYDTPQEKFDFATDRDTYKDSRCTDWQGQIVNHVDWKPAVTVIQGVIIVWRPYSNPFASNDDKTKNEGRSLYCSNVPADAYCDALKEASSQPKRNIRMRIYAVGTTAYNIPSQPNDKNSGLQFNAVDPDTNLKYENFSKDFVSQNTDGTNRFTDYTYTWTFPTGCSLPSSIKLKAEVQLAYKDGSSTVVKVSAGSTLTQGNNFVDTTQTETCKPQ